MPVSTQFIQLTLDNGASHRNSIVSVASTFVKQGSPLLRLGPASGSVDGGTEQLER